MNVTPRLTQPLKPELHPWIRTAARFGHIAVGLVYIVLGVVAFIGTLDVGVRPVGVQGSLRRVLESHAGTAFLAAIGFGLVTDGFWQGLRAVCNFDGVEADVRGYLSRGSWVIVGIIHIALGIVAIKLALGIRPEPTENQVQFWTKSIMALHFGDWIILGGGIVAIIIGIIFIGRAMAGNIDRWLDLSSVHRPIKIMIIMLGRFGVAARGAVLMAAGTLFVLAVVHVNPQEAHGLGGTLRTIESHQYGHFLVASIALGFIAYGIFELALAGYRRIGIPTAGRKS